MPREVLFLHPNFPAQFKNHIEFHIKKGDKVTFICLTNYRKAHVSGVNILKIKRDKQEFKSNPLLSESDKMLSTSALYLSAFRTLARQGYAPDLVISHSGWGCGSKIRCVWPDVLFISYLEWWFWDNEAPIPSYILTKTDWMRKSFALQKGGSQRNSLMALELANANKIICPSPWQKSLLPLQFRANASILFDGVDTSFFHPNTALKQRTDGKLVVTYGTRGMEPMRGFPEFILAARQLLQSRDDVIIKIAGRDEISYFNSPPPMAKSWGAWARQKLLPWISRRRVHFTGHLSKYDYRRFLQASHVHVYLSVDFVTSWSFYDAIACGCSMVTWNTHSLFLDSNGHSGRIAVPSNSVWDLEKGINSLLNCSDLRESLSSSARELSFNFNTEKFISQWSNIV